MNRLKIKTTATLLAILIIASMAFIAPIAATETGGIVGLWDFNEGLGSTALDSSGNSNHGTLSGGKFGNALSFDGVDDYIDLGTDVDAVIASSITLEAWIKPTGVQRGGIISNDVTFYSPHNGFDFFLWEGDVNGRLYLDFGDGDTLGRIWYSIPSMDWYNQWHHVAGTWDGTTMRLYVDGVHIPELSHSGPYSDSGRKNLIGAISYTSVIHYFNGLIDEVRISDTVRYPIDFTPPTTSFTEDTNTVGLWHFDESVETTAYDSSGNSNHGTIYGATWAGPTWITGALQFDGVDDYVDISDSTSLDLTEFTIEARVCIEELKRYNAIIIKGRDGAENYELLVGYPTSDDVVSAVLFTDGRDWLSTGKVIDLNTWHHIAVTYTSTEWKIFVDGVVEAERIYSDPRIPRTNDLPLWIGNEQGTSGRVTKGIIDYIRIWNVALPIEGLPIDIKPGSDPNSINLGEQGLLPVAVLGSSDFDVTWIDPETIEIGGVSMAERGSKKAPKMACSYEDVNGDGYTDLVAFFSVSTLVDEGGLEDITTELELMGNLHYGTPIRGTDSVRVVPP